MDLNSSPGASKTSVHTKVTKGSCSNSDSDSPRAAWNLGL